MRITLNDEEVREAIGLLLIEKKMRVLDDSIVFSVNDYDGNIVKGEITFSAEVEE